MRKVIVIGVAGASASGKTTVASRIKKEFGNSVELISHDFYYKRHDELTYEERTLLNYDHPNAFDTDRLIEDIRNLKNGVAIDRPDYDFTLHNRSDKTIRVNPAKVIILEGILIFENKELLDLMDIKIYVDTDADVRLIRRIVRDVKERGRDLDSVIKQYQNTVKPMHEQFVEPSKKYADIIIPEGGQNEVALSMIIDKIHSILSNV